MQALRLTPIGDGGVYGRAGLLAHPYMLGPNGDSNGCVSVKDYDALRRAHENGQIRRLMVVASANQVVAPKRSSTWHGVSKSCFQLFASAIWLRASARGDDEQARIGEQRLAVRLGRIGFCEAVAIARQKRATLLIVEPL